MEVEEGLKCRWKLVLVLKYLELFILSSSISKQLNRNSDFTISAQRLLYMIYTRHCFVVTLHALTCKQLRNLTDPLCLIFKPL